MRKRTLAIGFAVALALSVGLFSACSQAPATIAQEPASSKTAISEASGSVADEAATLAATATATLGETKTGPIRPSTPSENVPVTAAGNAGIASDSSNTLYAIEDKGNYSVVKLGSESAAVTALQETLTDLGYLNGATGYFGTDTEAALEAFQEANHLTVDGIAGNSTWDVILAGNAIEA